MFPIGCFKIEIVQNIKNCSTLVNKCNIYMLFRLHCFVLRQQTKNDERQIEREKRNNMKFIYEKNEINLERWKQSDIIHTIPNNICQLADMTFNQINYAMDFTFVSGIFLFFCCRRCLFSVLRAHFSLHT